VVAVALILVGCAGAGPAAGTVSGRTRCGARADDEMRAMYFVFCMESP
jgi:hypothetical protein